MRDVYIVQSLMDTDLYKLLRTQVSNHGCSCKHAQYLSNFVCYWFFLSCRNSAKIIFATFCIKYFEDSSTFIQRMSYIVIWNLAICCLTRRVTWRFVFSAPHLFFMNCDDASVYVISNTISDSYDFFICRNEIFSTCLRQQSFIEQECRLFNF